MVANILPADPKPLTPHGMGSKDLNLTFSEHGHVAHQIKWNHECKNMVANILHTTTPDPEDGAKLNFFRTWSSCISN